MGSHTRRDPILRLHYGVGSGGREVRTNPEGVRRSFPSNEFTVNSNTPSKKEIYKKTNSRNCSKVNILANAVALDLFSYSSHDMIRSQCERFGTDGWILAD